MRNDMLPGDKREFSGVPGLYDEPEISPFVAFAVGAVKLSLVILVIASVFYVVVKCL